MVGNGGPVDPGQPVDLLIRVDISDPSLVKIAKFPTILSGRTCRTGRLPKLNWLQPCVIAAFQGSPSYKRYLLLFTLIPFIAVRDEQRGVSVQHNQHAVDDVACLPADARHSGAATEVIFRD